MDSTEPPPTDDTSSFSSSDSVFGRLRAAGLAFKVVCVVFFSVLSFFGAGLLPALGARFDTVGALAFAVLFVSLGYK